MVGSQCILVADDHEDIRLTLVDILEARGYRVGTASDGSEAVSKVRSRSYCLVIMDVRMPRKDGPQALKEMKELRPDTPVVMISAYPVEQWGSEVAGYGPVAMLTKPLDLEQLMRLVEKNCSSERET